MCVCHSWFYIKLIRIANWCFNFGLANWKLAQPVKNALIWSKNIPANTGPPQKWEHQVRMEFFNKCGVSKSVSSYPKESSSTIVGS